MARTLNKNSPVMRIVITLVGIALILLAIKDIGLVTIGKKTTALDIQTSRYSSQPDMNRDVDQQYKWTVTYKFVANGKEYSGSQSTSGSSYGVKTKNTIYYYPFAPQINSMYAEDAVGLGTLFYFLIGGFLIIFINKKPKKSNRFKGKTEKQVATEMTTYDDSVEEFYDESDKKPTVKKNEEKSETIGNTPAFCRNCVTKLGGGAKFCPNCGEKTVSN